MVHKPYQKLKCISGMAELADEEKVWEVGIHKWKKSLK